MNFIPEKHARYVCEELNKLSKNFRDFKWKIHYSRRYDAFCMQGKYKRPAEDAVVLIPVDTAEDYFEKWATPAARLTDEAKPLIISAIELVCIQATAETNLNLN